MARRAANGPYMVYTGARPTTRESDQIDDGGSFDDGSGSAYSRGDRTAHLPSAASGLIVGLVLGALLTLWLAPVADRKAPAPTLPAVPTADAAPEIRPQTLPAGSPPAVLSAAPTPHAADRTAGRRATVGAAASEPAGRGQTVSCRENGGRAEAIICAEASFAAADRTATRAYDRAVSAGMRPDQIDWLVTREAAARRSSAALAQAYRERIAELNAFANDPPH